MSDLQFIDAYLGENRAGYTTLVAEVLEACKQIKASTNGLIYRCYSRGEKQTGNNEIKDAAKILDNLEPPVTKDKLKALHDIVGATVVIYYPDDADDILLRILNLLEKKSIRKKTEPKKHTGGYHALHSVLRSVSGVHAGLLCELQIKTVLHDAWSAKMHDLTYKPEGAIDGRLQGLMSAVSSQIEGIEQQSIIIRNIINGRHRLESQAFKSLCGTMWSVLGSGRLDSLGAGRPEASELWRRIDEFRAQSTSGNFDSEKLQKLVADIDSLCEAPPFVKIGWLLMTKVASGLLFGDFSRAISIQVDSFLKYAAENLTEVDAALLISVPNAFYVAGDLRRAAQYCDIVAAGPFESLIDEHCRLALRFNRLTYLLELEHLRPMRNQQIREKLKQDVKVLLEDESYKKDEEMESAFMDTEGLYKIVFGDTPAEVRSGIELCTRSVELAKSWEMDVALACRDWRVEAGWLRYFDLVTRPDRN
jgi:ppGpp synthetase/RelA/SpoT-type nucleotidyltranferase